MDRMILFDDGFISDFETEWYMKSKAYGERQKPPSSGRPGTSVIGRRSYEFVTAKGGCSGGKNSWIPWM